MNWVTVGVVLMVMGLFALGFDCLGYIDLGLCTR